MRKVELDTIKNSVADLYSVNLNRIDLDLESSSDAVQNYVSRKPVEIAEDLIPKLEEREITSPPKAPHLSYLRIEQNIDEAYRYAQNCLRLKREFGEIAKLWADVHYKSEEFFGLDKIHLEEISAGLFKLPWQEAENQKNAAEEALRIANEQEVDLLSLFGEKEAQSHYFGQLSKDSVQELAVRTADAATLDAKQKPDIRTAVEWTSNHRSSIEVAGWDQRKKGFQKEIARLGEEISSLERKLVYLKKDEEFRALRAQVSRDIAYLQLNEHTESGAVLNYRERLDAIKPVFEQSYQSVCQRVIKISEGFNSLHGIELRIDRVAQGSRSEYIATWIAKAQEALLAVKRKQKVHTYTILARTSEETTANNGQKRFVSTFDFDEHSQKFKKAFLRGLNIEALNKLTHPINVSIEPPEDLVNHEGQNLRKGLILGQVSETSPNSTQRPQHTDTLWNLPLSGKWRVTANVEMEFPKVDGFLMHLWLASE